MNWRERIVADWPDDLQKNHRAKTALAELDRVLSELAGLGHPLHVEDGYVPPPPPGWPKARFHLHAGARIVRSQVELEELGEGWYATMEEARHAAGMAKQYQRGGIWNPRALPTMLTQTPQQVMKNQEAVLKAREEQRRYVSDTRLANRAGFAGQQILIDRREGDDHEPDMGEMIERLRLRQ